jgi:hypothetical protein
MGAPYKPYALAFLAGALFIESWGWFLSYSSAPEEQVAFLKAFLLGMVLLLAIPFGQLWDWYVRVVSTPPPPED